MSAEAASAAGLPVHAPGPVSTRTASARLVPDATARASTGRNAGIDALRGMSILLVVMHHLGLRIPLRHGVLAEVLPTRVLATLTGNGYEAVFVFFVVSGYLIASNTLTRHGTLASIDVRAFYRRRSARILPCLLILVAVLATLDLFGANHFVIDRSRQTLARTVVAALGWHLNWYEGVTGYLPANWDVLWSLSIEELFYGVFPIVCVLSGRGRWLTAFLILFALSMPWLHAADAANEIWQEKAYLPGMAAIASGIAAALLSLHRRPTRRVILSLRILGSVGLVGILFFEDLMWRTLADGCMLVLTVSTAALLVALRGARSTRRVAWLSSCGRLSYEIYLSHMFVIWLTVDLFHRTGADTAWGFAWYAPAVGFSWIVGWMTARWISVPARRWLSPH